MWNFLWWLFWAWTWWLHFTLQLTSQKQLCSQHENLLVWPEMLQSWALFSRLCQSSNWGCRSCHFLALHFIKIINWWNVVVSGIPSTLCPACSAENFFVFSFHNEYVFNNKSAFSNFLLLEITLVHCIFSQRFSFSHRHLRPLPSAKS